MKFFSLSFFAARTAACLLALAPLARAITIYDVTINTTALSGQSGSLAFDFIGGDAATANNTLTVSNFASNGTLNLSGFALSDPAFFNETLKTITFGTSLSFRFQLTENRTGPGADQFSFFLLDSTFSPLGNTTDPTGAGALFAIDITGAAGGALSTFGSGTTGLSWQVTRASTANVPDATSTLALAGAALGLLGLTRFRRDGTLCPSGQ